MEHKTFLEIFTGKVLRKFLRSVGVLQKQTYSAKTQYTTWSYTHYHANHSESDRNILKMALMYLIYTDRKYNCVCCVWYLYSIF